MTQSTSNSIRPNSAVLEHANLTVSDPDKTAALLCDLFDWKVRWSGPALDNGKTVHVGNAGDSHTYLALYTHPELTKNPHRGHKQACNLNHIGIVVADLDETEARVVASGLVPNSHADYVPGRRFYFDMHDDIEIEVVSYTA